ncbi:MAG TPA: hypothetical protein VGH97_05575 [Thermoanaerobaculia bacterium]
MRLLEPRPARVSFLCDCRASLSFSTFDRLGDRQRVACSACGRVWEQALLVEDGDRGWKRSLLSGPAAPARAAAGGRSRVPS